VLVAILVDYSLRCWLAASGACLIDSVCLCGYCQTLSSRFSYSFSQILMKLCIHDLCASMEKTGTDFQNFDFKIFDEFKKKLSQQQSCLGQQASSSS